MMYLLRIELYKIFRKPRTYIAFGTVFAITFLFELAMWANGKEFSEFILQGINNQFSIQGKLINGYLVTYLILGMLLVDIPLLVALVAGDIVSGEAASGTLRLLLTKPVGRVQLLLVKYLATVIYSIALLIWLAIVGLAFSLLLFGSGDLMITKSDEIIVLLKDDVLWRYCCAFGFAALAMMAVSALSVFLSVLSQNSIGPIVSTIGIIVVLSIISNLDLPLFAAIHPFLITTHMLGWKGFFSDPVPVDAMLRSTGVLLSYIVVLLGTGAYLFNRKDIQS